MTLNVRQSRSYRDSIEHVTFISGLYQQRLCFALFLRYYRGIYTI